MSLEDSKYFVLICDVGCDEGCAAYVMVEMQDEQGKTIPGFERGKCIIL